MASLYGDEDFSHPVAQELHNLGHDVLTASEAGQANRGVSDDAVVAFATSCGRAVLTFNRRDFIKVHRRNPSHAGIIVCTRDDDVVALAARIDAALGRDVSLRDSLIRIYRPS